MNFRQFIIVMSIATLAVWMIWMFVLTTIDPTITGGPGFIFFYLTLGVAFMGTFTILGCAMRRLFRRKEMIYRQVAVSFRQAILLAMLMIAALFLFGKGLFTLWNMVILVTAFSFLEMACLFSRRTKFRS
jgi:hypothetical protein